MTVDLTQLCERLQVPMPVSRSATPLALRGVSTLELARKTDLCFAESADQADRVQASGAGVVLVPADFPEVPGPALVRVAEPRTGFFAIAALFQPGPDVEGIHASAVIDPSARLGAGVAVGACAVIGAGVRVGAGCSIGPGVYLGPGVTLGADCTVEANATVHRDTLAGERVVIHAGAVIGGDGFGFRWDGQAHRKIPQLGRVVLEDDVDIGCNSCVDRATLGETRVRRGAKIDNLVQIGHNTEIGAHAIMVGQAGAAGSCRIGAGAIIAGQVAVSDHVEVGAGARVGGQSGVTKDVPPGATVFGTPARPLKATLREQGALARLPELLKEFRSQRQELETLRRRLEDLEARAVR